MEVLYVRGELEIHTNLVNRRHSPVYRLLHLLFRELFDQQITRLYHIKRQFGRPFAILLFDVGSVDVELISEEVKLSLHQRKPLRFMIDDEQ